MNTLSKVTQQPLPAPPDLENAPIPKDKKTMKTAGCCFLGMAVGTIVSTPFLLGGLTIGNFAAMAPSTIISGAAAAFYNVENNHHAAEREATQQYLNTLHRHITSQPTHTAYLAEPKSNQTKKSAISEQKTEAKPDELAMDVKQPTADPDKNSQPVMNRLSDSEFVQTTAEIYATNGTA